MLDNVAHSQTGGVDVDFAQTGALVCRRRGDAGALQLSTIQWIDGAGKNAPLLAKPGAYSMLQISPDGNRLSFVEAGDDWYTTCSGTR
jgi:hypothetical protein